MNTVISDDKELIIFKKDRRLKLNLQKELMWHNLIKC